MLEKSFNIKLFSTFQRLLKVMSSILKFIKTCKGIIDLENELNNASFIEESKTLCLRYLQVNISMNQDKFNLKESLRLFKESEGLYRCGGRLGKANIMHETKHLVILPNDHKVTELIIVEGHFLTVEFFTVVPQRH